MAGHAPGGGPRPPASLCSLTRSPGLSASPAGGPPGRRVWTPGCGHGPHGPCGPPAWAGSPGAGAAVWEVSVPWSGPSPPPRGVPPGPVGGAPGRHLSGPGCTCWGGAFPRNSAGAPGPSPRAQGSTAVHEGSPQGACPAAVPGAPGAVPSVHSRCRAPTSRRPPARHVPAGGRSGVGWGSCAEAPKPERRAGGLRGGGGRGGDPPPRRSPRLRPVSWEASECAARTRSGGCRGRRSVAAAAGAGGLGRPRPSRGRQLGRARPSRGRAAPRGGGGRRAPGPGVHSS